MLPTEFLARYGQCVSTTVKGTVGEDNRILPNADRYLLVFWSSEQTWEIRPGSGDDVINSFVSFDANHDPIFLTHALHGSLVNGGWRLRPTMVDQTFTYIEGFMRSGIPGSVEGIPTVATPTNLIQSVTQQIPPSVIPPMEYVQPIPVEIPESMFPWIPSEDVPPGTRRLIQRLTRPGEYRTPTPEEFRLAQQYGWRLFNIDMDGFYAEKLRPGIRY